MDNKDPKNSFILYTSYEEDFKEFTLEERGQLITAILEYEKNGAVEIELPRDVNIAFRFIRKSLDKNRAEYERKCQINAQNGAKGGRPRKQTVSQKTERFSKKNEKTR